MERLRWGILAPGNIAHAFARGIAASQSGQLVAVASRELDRAKTFCEQHGGRPIQGYDALLAEPDIDAVYIATPHHLHAAWTEAAARAGKAILCEKPFTLNAIEAERTLAVVRSSGVFFMEAFMYRCHPQTRKVLDWVRNGAIGRVLAINSEFAFAAGRDWDNFRADGAVGGGGLMDVGTYCVSFSRAIAGEEPDRCEYTAQIRPDRGYDEFGAGLLSFPSGIRATFHTGIHLNATNDARIYGEGGWIRISSPWLCSPESVMELHRYGQEAEILHLGTSNPELYAFEADAVAASLSEKESPMMNWQDTLDNMRALDALRSSAGLRFAQEVTA